MDRLNFDNFKVKNADRTTAFEDLCRNLFLREQKKYDCNYSYDKNQAGLEMDPILNNGDNKYYGLQAKFFETCNNQTKYSQINDSLNKAYEYYPNLDYIEIYTNSELEHSVSEEVLASKSKTARINIARRAKEKGVLLKWIQKDNILDKVHGPDNIDLYNQFFCESRELEFLDHAIKPDDKTFLMSDEYLELKLSTNIDICKPTNDKINDISLLLGTAGTGKSMLMKKMHMKSSKRYAEYFHDKNPQGEHPFFPVFVRLREVVDGDLENIIRCRKKDFKLNHIGTEIKHIYFLDGLDEVSEKYINNVVAALEGLIKEHSSRIIISSRTGSTNLILLRQRFETIDHTIENLELDDIERYFNARKDKQKQNMLQEVKDTDVVKDIDDIFSVKLLWENIGNIDKSTSKINMIEMSVNYWIESYSKLSSIPLLEPKVNGLFDICTEIAYFMQKNSSLFISLSELQAIIMEKFKVNSANDTNIIISCLLDLFLECGSYSSADEKLSYKHRRFQEYFLYQKIDKVFINDPSILRELNLLSNKDFVITVFLRTSLSKAKQNRDLIKYLALKTFEYYLGDNYISRSYRDELVGNTYLFGAPVPTYAYSDRFVFLLSTYSWSDLCELLNDTNLNIKNAITVGDYWRLAELHHRNNGTDISEHKSINFSEGKESRKTSSLGSYLYYLHKVQGKSIEEILDWLIERQPDFYTIPHEKVKTNYDIKSNFENIISLVDFLLEFGLDSLQSIIRKADNNLLEAISYCCLKFKNVKTLLDHSYKSFRKCFTTKIENREDHDYHIHTIVLYNFISNKQYKKEDMEKKFEEANKPDYWNWREDIELNIFLSYILNKDKLETAEAKLGVSIFKICMYEEDNHDVLLNKWIEEIQKYNFIYKNGLIHSNSRIMGELISNVGFNPLLIKKFLRKVSRYETVINLETLLFVIFKNNKELFNKVVNKSLLDYAIKKRFCANDYYESISESLYGFAAMYSCFDPNIRHKLLIKGLNNDFFRPSFKGEDLYSWLLPNTIKIAYENYWIEESKLEDMAKLICKNIAELSETTDNGKELGYLKHVIQENIPNSGILELEDFNQIKPFDYDEVNTNNNYDFVSIDKSKLKKHYLTLVDDSCCSSEVWRELIYFELEELKSLNILFEVFKESRYPGTYGHPLFKCVHIPISILLEDSNTKDIMFEFLIENPGKNALYNMVRVYSLLGEVESGMKCLEFLLTFSSALLSGESNNTLNKDDYQYEDIIWTERGEWETREEEQSTYLKGQKNIKIIWDDYGDRKRCYEEWATKHMRKDAYIYNYKIYKNNVAIKEVRLVTIDGYRAVLPMPKPNTQIVKRDEYLLSRIFNFSVEELNSYMISSGLTVE